MASVWGELKRRNVAKVAVAYAIVGWLLIEIAATIFPIVQLPDWTVTLLTMLILFGFPVALLLSWAYELTPEGMMKTKAVPLSESVTQATGRKIDFAIIGALVLALGFMVYNYVLVDSDQEAIVQESVPIVQPAAETPAPVVVEEERAVLPNSVAVLLFDNLSPNPDDAYFAAGLHDEILNQLQKLSNLSVISRTSVLRYTDSDLSIPEIARELNVGTVMEGSVRYANNQVRITTQLIDAETDEHLWSETYDREFADIFAIESDIAMNIANALETEFSVEEQASIEKIPTDSPAAYALYLKARSTPWSEDSVEADIDSAIALDPEFALAYAWKAFYYAYALSPSDETDLAIRENAERALTLDPTIGLAHTALGVLHESRWRTSEAQQAFESAYQLSPNDASTVIEYARFLRLTGNYVEAIRNNQRAVELEPNHPGRYRQLGTAYTSVGDYAAAVPSLRKAIELDPTSITSYIMLARAEAARGNDVDALRELEIAERLDPSPIRLAQMAVVYAQIDRREDAVRLFNELEMQVREMPVNDALWAMAYIGVGDYEEARERLANAIDNQVPSGAFSFAVFRIPFTNLKSNAWRDPELDKPEFQELRDRIFALD